ncbi:MAG: CoA-binding protein [Deltaproteobacteria bacterium]|jgi:hypothetical protein|nr:CoA-binding protein [Desulfobacterales bacterium]MDL1975451.1 CoA-binding protein [Deltaproteobacteria bacterium]
MEGNRVTDNIRDILETCRNIAVVGLSPKPHRDSFMVARYMQEKGYRIIPIHPKAREILGERVYPDLGQVPDRIDMVNVFRASDKILPVAREAISVKPKVFWTQVGIENAAAARLLEDAGIRVVMNKCLKIEHMEIRGEA